MQVVLGIDAAWTSTQPSGVAVVAKGSSGWRLVAVSGSYQRFQALADGKEQERPASGGLPDAPALLAAAAALTDGPVHLVAIDMPLARLPIVGRRASDNAVSRAYGARQCGTHTPSAARPGQISDNLTAGFAAAGYPLLTSAVARRGLIEVYPHPALVELARASARLPYKASKVRAYWPQATATERRSRLYDQWKKIVVLLEREIAGIAVALPTPVLQAKAAEIKNYEDKLDAIVCAWVAISALEGRARPFGDENSAIWIPAPLTVVT